MSDHEQSAETDGRAVLDMVEARIRHQSKSAQVGSMEWRAHMADLMHIADVRCEVFPPGQKTGGRDA